MDESKLTKVILLGALILMIITYFYTASISLSGSTVDMDSLVIAAISG